MEFLAGERLCEMVENRNSTIIDVLYVSPEITSFFVDLVGKNKKGKRGQVFYLIPATCGVIALRVYYWKKERV
jgi:hypothetical protein